MANTNYSENLILDEEKHEYSQACVIIPSVSEIMQSANLADYSFVDPDILHRSQEFGKAVHSACHLSDLRTLDISSLSPPLIPYLDGWKKFVTDYKMEMVESEKPLAYKNKMYAGTIDRICKDVYGKLWLVDIKTSSKIHRAVEIQTAAYKMLYEYNYTDKISSRMVVQLTDNGYTLQILDKTKNALHESIFLSCLQIYNWKKKK